MNSKTLSTTESLTLGTGISILLLALPCLNPFSYGPTPAVAQGLVVWLAAALCWLLCELAGLRQPARERAIAAAWLLAAVISAAMGLLQYMGLADRFSPWVNYVEAGQAYANLRQRNQLATLLGMGLAALLWWQPTPAFNKTENVGACSWFPVVAWLLAAADAASASRTGLVQLLLLAALSLVWRRGRATLVLALLAYTVAAFALPLLLPHALIAPETALQTGILARVGEASGRGILWDNVLHLIALKPWLGWGWGELHYAHFITLYPGERFADIMGNAHNLPLHVAVTLGLPASILFCVAMLWLVLRAQPWREQNATRQLAWSVLAVIGVHSLLEYPLWYGPFQLAAVLAVWMLWQTRQRALTAAAPGPGERQGRAALFVLAVAVVLLAGCSYALWDYWRISQIYLPVSKRAAQYQDDTLNKIRASWLFQRQVQFAELGTTTVTPDNAQTINSLAKELLHFSPEASVVQKLIDSALLLGNTEEAAYFAQRYQAAFPQDYAVWRRAQSSNPGHKAP